MAASSGIAIAFFEPAATSKFRVASQCPQTRVRRAHHKSRQGCANCKLRRVKCDETKPTCRKCTNYGVGCSYAPDAPKMQFSLPGASSFEVDFGSLVSPPPVTGLDLPIRLPLARCRSYRDSEYELSSFDRAILDKFENTRVVTFGSQEYSRRYQEVSLQLTRDNPYLMHILLALTTFFDLHHRGPWDKVRSTALNAVAFHLYHGVTLFHAKLSGAGIDPEKENIDDLWASAAFIASSVFADISATSISEAWPLTPTVPSPTDLDWLKLTGGKQAVWKLVNPTRRGSRIAEAAPPCVEYFVNPTISADFYIANLPAGFIRLYGLTKSSTLQNNPYHGPATVLAQILPLDDLEASPKNVPKFLSFISGPDPRFVNLLQIRDPRALLLLAYWYAKAVQYKSQWWLVGRASLEGAAICVFLERECGGDRDIMELVASPKAAFAAFFEDKEHAASGFRKVHWQQAP